MPTLTHIPGPPAKFIWQGDYHTKDLPKAAGFRWNPTAKHWHTPDPLKAARLLDYADPAAKALLSAVESNQDSAIAESRAAAPIAPVNVPAPAGLTYMPFQLAGIAYAVARPNTLIADEMGLGKTIQAVGLINACPEIRRVLIVCPAHLRLNWRRELEKWLVRPATIGICETKTAPEAQIRIAHYDIFSRKCPSRDTLRAEPYDLLILDEAHYCKNGDALRTAHILGRKKTKRSAAYQGIEAKRRLYLSGTPATSRPRDLFPLLNSLDPVNWSSFYSYAVKYCAGFKSRWGFDSSGSSNPDELQSLMRSTLMVRRLKKDVLEDLPAKRRTIVELPQNGSAGVIAAEAPAMARLKAAAEALDAADPTNASAYAAAVRSLNAICGSFDELSQMRHDTAVAKIPATIQHIQDALDSGSKVVAFGHHIDVIDAVAEAFPGCEVAHGKKSMEARDQSVQRFQTDESCRLIVCGIQAMGTGHTLTASSHVILFETSWLPSDLSQAEDRCHRIGQKSAVSAEYLVFDGSLDAYMLKIITKKMKVLDATLDNITEGHTATEQAVRDQLAILQVAAKTPPRPVAITAPDAITPDQVDAIKANLCSLSAVCDGALEEDGQGFNGMDSRFGKALAGQSYRLTQRQAAAGRKMLRKYKKQLGEDAITAMGESK